MSRFLTPSKVSLLALIWLYSTSGTPEAGFAEISLHSNRDVLSFVISHILPGASKTDAGWRALQLSDFENVLKDVRSGTWPPTTGWNIFLEKIWTHFRCLDDLYSFFKFLPSDVFEPTEEEEAHFRLDHEFDNRPVMRGVPLTRTSPLGVFVRRASLEFTRLQFDGTIKLWEDFIRYRASTQAAWFSTPPNRRRSTRSISLAQPFEFSEDDPAGKKAYGHLHGSMTSAETASVEDVERLLEYQIEQLQSM